MPSLERKKGLSNEDKTKITREAIRRAVEGLRASGEPLSKASVARLTGVSPPTLRKHWRDITGEENQKDNKERSAQSRKAVVQAVEYLRSHGMDVTIDSVVRQSGTSWQSARRYLRDMCAIEPIEPVAARPMVERTGDIGQDIIRAVDVLRAGGRQVSIAGIVNATGIEKRTVQKYCGDILGEEPHPPESREVHERNRSLVLRTTREWTDAGRRFTQHDVATACGLSVSCVRLFWDFVEGRAFVLQPSRAAKFEETRDAMRRAVALIRHSGAPLTVSGVCRLSGLAFGTVRRHWHHVVDGAQLVPPAYETTSNPYLNG